MKIMHSLLAAATAGVMLTGALVGSGSASAASEASAHAKKARSFAVTGGKVIITLDPAFTAALSEAGATFSVGGAGSMSTDKDTGMPVITLPVLKNPGNILALNAFPKAAMKLYLGGTIIISGNGVTRTGTSPMLQVGADGGSGLSATFGLGGYGEEPVAGWGNYPFPKSYGGKTWLLDVGPGTTPEWGILYRGQSRFLDQPGDGPMPNYKPGGPFGNLQVFVKIKPQR